MVRRVSSFTNDAERHGNDSKTGKSRLDARCIFWTLFPIFLCPYFLTLLLSTDQLGERREGRHLLSSSECDSHPDWIKHGGFLLYIFAVCYLFIGVAIICEKYFVKSMSAICVAYNIPDDIAGATFMAAGSSAPELFASFVSLVNDNAPNDIGVGTIVGSAVFNILCIIGVTALFTEKPLKLSKQPLLRDCGFYVIAILSIAAIFKDGKVYWWEGLISVTLYIVYILAMKFAPVKDHQKYISFRTKTFKNVNVGFLLTFKSLQDLGLRCSLDSPLMNSDALPSTSSEVIRGPTNGQNRDSLFDHDGNASSSMENSNPPHESDCHNSWLISLLNLIQIPWRIVFRFTVPDCEQEKWKKWYMLTFVNSIIWIGLISWHVVEWTSEIGCIWGIPSAVMGVTILAAGTSIPDALSSVLVAKEGKGDMAVANAVGSNVFDIWLGLGLPWLLVIPLKGKDGDLGKFIDVDNNELVVSVLILLGILLFYLGSILLSGWKLSHRNGFIYLSLYLFYALYYIIAIGIYDIFNTED